MKKKKYWKARILALFFTTALIAFSGCGSGRSSSADGGATAAEEYNFAPMQEAKMAGVNSMDSFDMYEDEAVEAYEAAAPERSAGSSTVEPEEASSEAAQNSRKLITTIGISGETDSLDEFSASLEKEVNRRNGYIESSNIDNGNSYSRRKSASYTIRIPAAELNSFVTGLTNKLNVTNRNMSTEDVTLHYIDTEAHKKALEDEEKQLQEILMRTDDLSDILALEEHLADIRYELNSLRSQLRLLDNKVDYSTVNLNVSEVTTYTETVQDTVWDRISKGFGKNLEDVLEGMVDFLIWIVIHIPQFVILAIIIIFLVILKKKLQKAGKLKPRKLKFPFGKKNNSKQAAQPEGQGKEGGMAQSEEQGKQNGE